jgi:hypothetical protein
MVQIKEMVSQSDSSFKVSISAPCCYRFLIYQPFLQSSLDAFVNNFKFNDFIKSAITSPDLWQFIAELLDGQVQRFLENYFYQIRVANNFESVDDPSDQRTKDVILRQHKNFSEDQIKQYFNYSSQNVNERLDNYEEYMSKQSPQLPQFLHELYPCLPKFMEKINSEFQNAIISALNNINLDKSIIHTNFLPDIEATYRLNKIIPTGSDLHKSGKQVLILEFSDDKNNKTKVIYKPSSILIDCMIIGNNKKINSKNVYIRDNSVAETKDSDEKEALGTPVTLLNNLEEKIENTLSLAQRINSAGNLDTLAIKTYQILPRESNNKSESYGYIEYLTHLPWNERNWLIDILAIVNAKPQADYSNEIQELVIDFENSLMRNTMLSKSPACNDYIATDQTEYLAYSFRCGQLSSLSMLIGMTDMHHDNLLINKLNPVAIDLECSFNIKIDTIAKTGFLSPGAGGASSQKGSMRYAIMVDLTGIQKIRFQVRTKNTLYMLDKNQINPVAPNSNSFIDGFKSIFSILNKRPASIQDWYSDRLVKSMLIRIVPLPTQSFIEARDAALEIEPFHKDWCFKEKLKGYLTSQITSKKQIDFQDETISHNLIEEMRGLSIPTFYMYVNQKILIDSASRLVVDKYCDQTPHEYILNQYQFLTTNNDIIGKLEVELNHRLAAIQSSLNESSEPIMLVVDDSNNENNAISCCSKCTIS